MLAIGVGLIGRPDSERFAAAFVGRARDLVGTALVIALARDSMILARIPWARWARSMLPLQLVYLVLALLLLIPPSLTGW